MRWIQWWIRLTVGFRFHILLSSVLLLVTCFSIQPYIFNCAISWKSLYSLQTWYQLNFVIFYWKEAYTIKYKIKFVCNSCGRDCHSHIGMVSHSRCCSACNGQALTFLQSTSSLSFGIELCQQQRSLLNQFMYKSYLLLKQNWKMNQTKSWLLLPKIYNLSRTLLSRF